MKVELAVGLTDKTWFSYEAEVDGVDDPSSLSEPDLVALLSDEIKKMDVSFVTLIKSDWSACDEV